MTPREIEQFFHAKIPLTAAMGVRVESYDAQRLILTAPLDANHNHLGTAFGGSLAALLILSGYGLLWLELGDADSHILVRKTSLDYRRPVQDPLRAICTRPPENELATFKETFTRRGKARIELHATIEQGGETAVEFRGLFVARRDLAKPSAPHEAPPMHDILDLPEVRALVPRLSVAQYHQPPECNGNGKRTELIRGIVIEKMSKSPLRSRICSRLFRQIYATAPAGYLVQKDEPLTFADSEPEPDVFVVAGTDADFNAHHPMTAELAVEVAVTSLRLDREKAVIYAEAGVKEYWIVLAATQQVEAYRRPEGGLYRERRIYSHGETVEVGGLPAIRVEVAALFPA